MKFETEQGRMPRDQDEFLPPAVGDEDLDEDLDDDLDTDDEDDLDEDDEDWEEDEDEGA